MCPDDLDMETFEVNVDLVLCIDATGSMSPVIDMVKQNAMTFHERLGEALEEYSRELQTLRIKVIAYRDMTCDGDFAHQESRFFVLPQENEAFKDFVQKITAIGGGDTPETTLDTIALAMKSDWVKEGAKKRHVIMVWTDAPTKEPGSDPTNQKLPKDMKELNEWWNDPQMGCMNRSAKRLIVFAPDGPSWSFLPTWENTAWIKTELGGGMRDADIEVILAALCASI